MIDFITYQISAHRAVDLSAYFDRRTVSMCAISYKSGNKIK